MVQLGLATCNHQLLILSWTKIWNITKRRRLSQAIVFRYVEPTIEAEAADQAQLDTPMVKSTWLTDSIGRKDCRDSGLAKYRVKGAPVPCTVPNEAKVSKAGRGAGGPLSSAPAPFPSGKQREIFESQSNEKTSVETVYVAEEFESIIREARKTEHLVSAIK